MVDFSRFYSGAMTPPTRVNGGLMPTPVGDFSDFYGSFGITKKDEASNPQVLAAIGSGVPPSWVDAARLRQPATGDDRLPQGDPGLPLNPTGEYNPGNPLVLAALRAQQRPNPAVAAATTLATADEADPVLAEASPYPLAYDKAPRQAVTARIVPRGPTGVGTNGYLYANGKNIGKSALYADMKPGEMYDYINARNRA